MPSYHGAPQLETYFAPAERVSEETLQSQINLWAKNPSVLLFADAMPSGALILNEYRQAVYANQAFLRIAGNLNFSDVRGKRPGEILGCIHAFEMEGGCGTSQFCEKCGAVRAILSSLKGEEMVQECRIIRQNKVEVLYLRIWASPIKLNDHTFSIFAIQDIQLEIENKKLMKNLEKMAMTDILTGLHNRRHFYEHGKEEIERSNRYNHPLSVAMLDIDHFKKINDAYGHHVGDKVLFALAQQMRESMRKIDLIARYGGEEFVILLPEINQHEALIALDRLRESVTEMTIPTDKGLCKLTVSIGVAELSNSTNQDNKDHTIDSLLQQADDALYQAKENGRNQTIAWKPVTR